MIVKYIDQKMKKFWKWLERYSHNYKTLKRKTIKAYSKTLFKNKLIVAQLVKLVKKSVKNVVEDKKDFDTYYYKF